MTAEPATYSTMFVLEGGSSRRPDPVRARVSSGQQIVHAQNLQMGRSDRAAAEAVHRNLHLPADTRSRGPHPGDILYWVACLGGACLLLLSATT